LTKFNTVYKLANNGISIKNKEKNAVNQNILFIFFLKQLNMFIFVYVLQSIYYCLFYKVFLIEVIMMQILYKSVSLAIILMIITLTGCSDDKNPVQNTETETMPVINTITSDKLFILFGGDDKAIIKCDATGGNLKYVWQVDIGDLIPLNKDRSEVSFKGSACCIGAKIITCTVSNSKGSVSQNIVLSILEDTPFPGIIK
jgi:hypothetical protein